MSVVRILGVDLIQASVVWRIHVVSLANNPVRGLQLIPNSEQLGAHLAVHGYRTGSLYLYWDTNWLSARGASVKCTMTEKLIYTTDHYKWCT